MRLSFLSPSWLKAPVFRALVACLLAFPSGTSALPVTAPVDSVAEWIRAGQPQELVVRHIDKTPYLTVEHVARLSEAQLRWQPVASQACLSNSNGVLCFDWEMKMSSYSGSRSRAAVPLRFENDQLLIPMSFIVSPDFESFSATQLSWNAARSRLVQDPEVNLRVPQVERSNGVYRLALTVNPSAPPQLIEKSNEQIWLRFSRAITSGSQILEGDTVISEVRVNQRRRSADLLLKLGDDAEASGVYFEDDRRRLVIEVIPSPRALALATLSGSAARVEAKAELPSAVVEASTPRTKGIPIPVRAPAPAEVKPAPDADKSRSMTEVSPARKRGTRTIVIDAGHGGIDCGAMGVRGTMEKDINLTVARSLARELRKAKNVRVIMTREKDEFIPLHHRTQLANRSGADLFVSIHCNSALSSRGNGFETYFLSAEATDKAAAAVARMENSVVSLEAQKGTASSKLGQLLASMAVYDFINQSSKFAAIVCKKVRERSNVDKSTVKEADFFVLRGAQMPSVLVELEYLSNPISEMRLRSSRYQNQLVRGIAEGILAYDRQHRQEQEAYAAQPARDTGRTQR